MISKEKLDFAVKQVVDNCLGVQKNEKAYLITDEATKHIGLPIAEKLKEKACVLKTFIMEDFGKRSDDGKNPLKLPQEIKDAVNEATVGVFATQAKKGEAQSFRIPMIEIVSKSKALRHAHMVGVNDAIMEMGMSVDYKIVQEISKKVYDIVSQSKRIRVTTKLGSDFVAEFNPSWRWKICDGNLRKPGNWSNLPDGEVFTCPLNVNGKIIIDGVLGDHLISCGTIEKTPLFLNVVDGRVKEVESNNKEIENEVKSYIQLEKNSDRIGEFAIGTNIGLTKLIGNLLQDEKFPGVHIAVGHTYPNETGADWDCDPHMDMIIQKTTIEVDGKIIMKEGKFLI